MNEVVLVTSIGTVNANAVICELRRTLSNVRIIGADINDRWCVVNSRDVDEFYKFPCVVDTPKEYLEFLQHFCITHEVTDVFAFIDEEIVLLSKYSYIFKSIGVHLCIPEYHVVDICHYKDRFSDWMIENMPDYAIHRYLTKESVHYPAFLKPIEGRASIGCKKVINQHDLDYTIGDRPFSQFVVQPFLCGDIIAADVVRMRNGNVCRLIQRREIIRNGNGCGVAVEIVDEPSVANFCRVFAEKIDLDGVVNVEFLITTNGPKVIEVNPRLPAGTSYSCMAGFNIVMYAFAIANGNNCEIKENTTGSIGKRFSRRYETYEM